eukprot:TRINITY_DN14124_c0_g1_i1.p1 TRINITY_DN14124_c0_g1~~TRINITY_DN14124_c0_g1_i1.p1  ORF type:complete len:423 (-),score=89.30 TRINITY_DN14124_c0_g1_i1:32-1300(-)
MNFALSFEPYSDFGAQFHLPLKVGISAFIESLLKIGLHRLGFKGSSEIQRGSPAWWKCTWLLTLLNEQFREKLSVRNYECALFGLASAGEGTWEEAFEDGVGLGINSYSANSWITQSRMLNQPPSSSGGSSKNTMDSGVTKMTGNSVNSSGRPAMRRSSVSDDGTGSQSSRRNRKNLRTSKGPLGQERRRREQRRKKAEDIDYGPNRDADVWWRKVQSGMLLGKVAHHTPAMEWLANSAPDLFEISRAETVPGPCASADIGVPCRLCEERPSASGWGNPTCIACGGVEPFCLPRGGHPFSPLLKTVEPRLAFQEAKLRAVKDDDGDGIEEEDEEGESGAAVGRERRVSLEVKDPLAMSHAKTSPTGSVTSQKASPSSRVGSKASLAGGRASPTAQAGSRASPTGLAGGRASPTNRAKRTTTM